MTKLKAGMRYVLGVFMVIGGVMHFVSPDFYLPMMPEYLPMHEALVFLSGVAEIVAGVLIIVPSTQKIGGWTVIAVMLGVFPANLHMAMHTEEFADFAAPTALYLRLPLQLIPLAWAYWYTRPAASAEFVSVEEGEA